MSQLSTVYINSKDRMNYANTSSNTFTINLSPYGLVNTKSFVVKSVCIPYSYYTTSYPNANTTHAGNQYFTLNEIAGSQTLDIVLPFGNYSYSDLVTIFQTQLNDPGNTLSYKPYTVTYDTHVNKFVFRSSSVLDFELLFTQQYASQPDYKKLSTVLGFKPIDYTSSLVSGATQITSELTANLSGGPYVYIKSDTLTYQLSNFMNNKINTVVIGVPLVAAPNSIIYWEDQQLLQQRFRASLANIFNFQLVDDHDNLIDLNGLDWSMVICFYSDVI